MTNTKIYTIRASEIIYVAMGTTVLEIVGRKFDMHGNQLLGRFYRKRIDCNLLASHKVPEDNAQIVFDYMRKGFKVIRLKSLGDVPNPARLWNGEIRKEWGEGIKTIFDPNRRRKDMVRTLFLMNAVDNLIGRSFKLEKNWCFAPKCERMTGSGQVVSIDRAVVKEFKTENILAC